MEIMREIELDADPEDVWAALTDEAQLEEWFANEVELDPTPGGRGVFRWDNGETREAVVESVEEGSRIVLRFDDDGVVDLRVVADRGRDASSRCARRRPPGRPRSSSGSAWRSLLTRMRDPVDAVFSALADPSRRFVARDARGARHGDADRARGRPAGDPPGGGQAPRRAARGRARRGARAGRETRYALTPAPLASAAEWIEEVGAAWDARLDALRRLVDGG